MLGTEHNMILGLHLVVGGELSHQCFFFHTDSPELENKVLPGDMLAPYWLNFSEAYDDFENPVEACSG